MGQRSSEEGRTSWLPAVKLKRCFGISAYSGARWGYIQFHRMWEGFQPVKRDFEVLQSTASTQVAGMKQNVAGRDREDVRVCVGDTDKACPTQS